MADTKKEYPSDRDGWLKFLSGDETEAEDGYDAGIEWFKNSYSGSDKEEILSLLERNNNDEKRHKSDLDSAKEGKSPSDEKKEAFGIMGIKEKGK